MSCPSEPCHRAKSVQLVWSSRTGRCGDTWNTSKSVRTAGAHSRTMQEQISEACVESKAHHCIPSIVPALGLGNLCFWRPCQHVNMSTSCQLFNHIMLLFQSVSIDSVDCCILPREFAWWHSSSSSGVGSQASLWRETNTPRDMVETKSLNMPFQCLMWNSMSIIYIHLQKSI